MAVPEPLLQAEVAPLLGPDAARLREVLDALCLHDDDEIAGRALLRRTELRTALSAIAMSKPGPVAGQELAAAIEDVQAAGRKFAENSDFELRARLLAGRLLVRTMRVAPAAELLHGTRAAVKGKSRATRLQLCMLEAEIALESGAYADADRHFRRAIGLARTPQVAHEHYQAAMSLAACAQLNANARGAIPWLRRARTTATTHQDSVRLADACFALGNAAAFADGSILASQCQVQLGMEAEALETLDAGAKALRQQDLEPFAELVEAQKAQLLRGEA